MNSRLTEIITATDPTVRNQSLDALCAGATLKELLAECAALDAFRRQCDNLYERVRALFFLYAIHRFHIPRIAELNRRGLIPFQGYEHLLQRRFEEAINEFLSAQQREGPSDAISSALAAAYHRLAFQTLADQVRRSVRSVRGNQWMFRMGHPADQPLRIRSELVQPGADGGYPILRERTPVRMDLTHGGWSDIFFLGMDFPEGARVLNVSVDLGVHGRDDRPQPPVEAYLRVIEEPVLRLTSVDLGATADISNLSEVFDFAKDYLGLLKAAVIASGIVPPGIEGSGQSLAALLTRIVGEGRGLEIVSSVNNIPKGSRLAVTTNLLACLISVCMRATGQAASLTGQLQESERRLALARAILGEWIGGSGGGWQDSGGVWPGIKLIEGVPAAEGDPEFGISRGRLMPLHKVFSGEEISEQARQRLQDSLVLVHGGMAQNVGPILEMVTEKYLLRSEAEWKARQQALGILDEILGALRRGDVPAIGAATTRNFTQPIQTIIPWASTYYTELLIERAAREFGKNFWGFWMLGGMSGGGMGFIFAPDKKSAAQQRMQEIMSTTKRELSSALPFAMEPVVYDFAINENGTFADWLSGDAALMPAGYYALTVPRLLRQELRTLSPLRRAELDKFAFACRNKSELRGMVQTLFDQMLPRGKADSGNERTLHASLDEFGFDRTQHEQIRADLRDARIGLAQNRLSPSATIEDVQAEDVIDTTGWRRIPGAAVVGQAPSPGTRPAGAPACVDIPPFSPFEPDRPASIRQRHLPHWTQEGCTYFVTFRLADSVPKDIEEGWRREKEEHLRQLPKDESDEKRREALALFSARFEDDLDRGLGGCVLAEPEIAAEMERCLRHFDGERYTLGRYVIMPNHVHALVRPLMEHSLSDALQGWKSVSAHNVKKKFGGNRLQWQDESFDHIVRDETQLERFERYIEQNPVRARLNEKSFRLGIGTGGKERQAGAPVGQMTGGGACPTTLTAEDGRSLSEAGQQPGFEQLREVGWHALRAGQVAVVTLAGGAGSRWTQGAGVVKALHPFCKLGGKHRAFIETHLAKSRRVSREVGTPLPHVFTTSYLTHQPTEEFLRRAKNFGYEGPLFLSPGKSIGLRLVPTVRDLRFAWEEMPQQMLDEQQQKVRDSLRTALIGWARSVGEVSDYTDNVALQCLHPVGHWYEVPNLFRNGVLLRLLQERPQLQYLLLHNIDTLGTDVDPALLGLHIQEGACLSFEMITRRIDDRGGGLARVNGRPRILEGLAVPREEDEFALSYYNSMTTWIHLDKLLTAFGLTRGDLTNDEKVAAAVREVAAKMPTYITHKEVKKRWGHGQEDIFPVAQWEKLWSDMTRLSEIESRFMVVPRVRGQQLKDQAQLDGWLRDGSAAYVESLCEWA
ncbi:MAG TPA: UTP--glucose-1-phosphate uridylyltransferase [Verrucomicrobiota bacterium]|nr:UTP--glucose-1-phosphate uridylyltransferase [Verrucomicrobiota bacterium]